MTSGMGGDPNRGLNGGTQGDRLQDAASGLVDQAARTAEAQASNTMTKAGETLEQVARSIREAGEGLREQQPDIANFVDTAAQRVEGAASYLRERDAREVIDNLQETARRQPAIVLGGGLALGLLLGRFLKSGSTQGGQRYGAWDTNTSQTGYAGGYSGGGYAGGSTGYGSGSTGYEAGSGYASTGGAMDAGDAGVGGGVYASSMTGTGSELGSSSDTAMSDDFVGTETTSIRTDDILGDDDLATEDTDESRS